MEVAWKQGRVKIFREAPFLVCWDIFHLPIQMTGKLLEPPLSPRDVPRSIR